MKTFSPHHPATKSPSQNPASPESSRFETVTPDVLRPGLPPLLQVVQATPALLITILLLHSTAVSSFASTRVATAAAEAVIPVAARHALVEATEKTAATLVGRNFNTIVAESAASAATARVAPRTASLETIEATGKVLARPDRSKEILAAGAGTGLGTGIYSAMDQTGAGIQAGLTEMGKGTGDAARDIPKFLPLITAVAAGTGLGAIALILPRLPRRLAVAKVRIPNKLNQ